VNKYYPSRYTQRRPPLPFSPSHTPTACSPRCRTSSIIERRLQRARRHLPRARNLHWPAPTRQLSNSPSPSTTSSSSSSLRSDHLSLRPGTRPWMGSSESEAFKLGQSPALPLPADCLNRAKLYLLTPHIPSRPTSFHCTHSPVLILTTHLDSRADCIDTPHNRLRRTTPPPLRLSPPSQRQARPPLRPSPPYLHRRVHCPRRLGCTQVTSSHKAANSNSSSSSRRGT